MSTVDYASYSFTTFTTLTIFHLIIKLFLHGSYISKEINGETSTIGDKIDFVYFTLVLVILGVVFPLTSESAGKNGMYIWFPIVGYLLFIGLYYLIKFVVPGWKAPFSNTFGYLFATIGAGDTIDKFFKAMFNVSENDNLNTIESSSKEKAQLEISRNQKEIIRMVQTDRSLILNELTPENFSYFMELIFGKLSLQEIEDIKNNRGKEEYRFPLDEYETEIKQLESIVIKKDVWAEFFWLSLSGTYITSFIWSFLGNKPVNTIDAINENKETDGAIEQGESMTNMEGLTNKTNKKKKKKEKTIASNISTFTSSGVEIDKLPYVPG